MKRKLPRYDRFLMREYAISWRFLRKEHSILANIFKQCAVICRDKTLSNQPPKTATRPAPPAAASPQWGHADTKPMKTQNAVSAVPEAEAGIPSTILPPVDANADTDEIPQTVLPPCCSDEKGDELP